MGAVEAAPVDDVLDAAAYLAFKADYERAFVAMNKKEE